MTAAQTIIDRVEAENEGPRIPAREIIEREGGRVVRLWRNQHHLGGKATVAVPEFAAMRLMLRRVDEALGMAPR